jgi:hypothetical protein
MQCTCGRHTPHPRQALHYLKNPLKHVGQWQEGDEHILSAGLEYALSGQSGKKDMEGKKGKKGNG